MPTFSPSAQSVSQGVALTPTSITIAGPASIVEETTATFTFTLLVGTAPVPYNYIEVKIYDVTGVGEPAMTLMHTASIMTNPSGVATLTADMMQPGTMRFVATFAATSQYASSTAQGDVTVTTRTVATTLTLMLNCCPPVYVGQATEWYVTLTRSDTGGKLIGSATSPTAFPLSVSVDGTFVRTVQSGWQEAGISKSLAGWDTGGATLIVLAGLSVGTHTVTVSFAGVTTVEIP